MGRDESERFFYVCEDDLRKDRFRFPPAEEHHLVHVLRLADGARITVVDGAGCVAAVRIRKEGGEWFGVVESRSPSRCEPELRVTLACGLLKGRMMDEVIERCTEIGIAGFHPFLSERTVPRRTGAGGERRRERWNRIALSAMKVARAAIRPVVFSVATWGELLRSIPAFEAAVLCEQAATTPLSRPDGAKTILVVIGPEGGLTREEREQAAAHGARSVTLGPRNLRASTAASVAAARVLDPSGENG